MALSHTSEQPSRVEMETAAEQIRERLPQAAVRTYECTESIDAIISIEAASETEHGCVIATRSGAPNGWEIEEVSIHSETEGMMISYEQEESR